MLDELESMVRHLRAARRAGLTTLALLVPQGTLLHTVVTAYDKALADGVTPKYLCLHPDTVKRKGEPYVQAVAKAVDCSLVQSAYIPPAQAVLMAEGADLEFGRGFPP